MYGHAGMDAGWWVFMMFFWVGLAVAVVWVVVRSLTTRERPRRSSERPEEILEWRLASGEIDEQTYDQLRSRLGGGVLTGGN